MKALLRLEALAAAVALCATVSAREPLMHSHNDYLQKVPFYEAYSQGATCIECDMYYIGKDVFLVGHDKKDLNPSMTFERVYLWPVAGVFRANGGQAWINRPDRRLFLMVEIKSDDPVAYVDALEKKLHAYRDVFDPVVNPTACGLLIGGYHLPPYEKFTKYPNWFLFDIQYSECDGSNLTKRQLERVGMFSTNFRLLSKWDGTGEFDAGEKAAVKEVIKAVHAMGKPVRFWGAPDNPSAWKTLYEMGADFINTDHVEACAEFISGITGD